MFHRLKMNPAAYGRKLQGFPIAPRCPISRSNVVCLGTRINCVVPQPKSHDSQKLIGHCTRERMSADVCLKESRGYPMKLTLAMKSWCMVSLTIPILLIVKSVFLLRSRWVNVPILAYKMKVASIWSITCNIQHLATYGRQFYDLIWSLALVNASIEHGLKVAGSCPLAR